MTKNTLRAGASPRRPLVSCWRSYLDSLGTSPMKTYLLSPLALALCAMTLFANPAAGQVPQLVNYQGRVTAGSPAVNFNGAGQFKFALVNAAGTTTFWSNDGTSTGGNAPINAVALTVSNGLFSLLLGDTTLTNMSTLPVGVF